MQEFHHSKQSDPSLRSARPSSDGSCVVDVTDDDLRTSRQGSKGSASSRQGSVSSRQDSDGSRQGSASCRHGSKGSKKHRRHESAVAPVALNAPVLTRATIGIS